MTLYWGQKLRKPRIIEVIAIYSEKWQNVAYKFTRVEPVKPVKVKIFRSEVKGEGKSAGMAEWIFTLSFERAAWDRI